MSKFLAWVNCLLSELFSPQNSYVEVLTPSTLECAIFEDTALTKVSKLKWGY